MHNLTRLLIFLIVTTAESDYISDYINAIVSHSEKVLVQKGKMFLIKKPTFQ